MAHLSIIRLPVKYDDQDPGKAMRDHFLARQVEELMVNREDLQLTVVNDVKGKRLEGEAEFGKTKGFLGKYRLMVTGGTRERFVILATVPKGDGIVGVYCDTSRNSREFWEQEVADLLASYRLVE
jgi:hypothetical protein